MIVVKCSDTFKEVLVHSADSDTFLEGTNINFSCLPGLVLTGPNSSTCMGNGEWEPNPNEVQCKGEYAREKLAVLSVHCYLLMVIKIKLLFMQLIVVYL